MKFTAIIPARFASSRFPGKPLADMKGKPMIQRVYEQVGKAVDDVWVATDDLRIFEAVESFGGKVVMTSEDHRSGTDRCHEACEKVAAATDVVINVQGDEPFIQPEQIRTLMDCFAEEDVKIATLAKAFRKEDGFEPLFNPNHVKVNFNLKHEAICFSRAILPYMRNYTYTEWLEHHTFYKHIGMYAYRKNVLDEITRLPQSSLEIAESLEQLRWIENGYKIKIGFTEIETIGIDTPEDMEKAISQLELL